VWEEWEMCCRWGGSDRVWRSSGGLYDVEFPDSIRKSMLLQLNEVRASALYLD
jgi:hypothetical protein